MISLRPPSLRNLYGKAGSERLSTSVLDQLRKDSEHSPFLICTPVLTAKRRRILQRVNVEIETHIVSCGSVLLQRASNEEVSIHWFIFMVLSRYRKDRRDRSVKWHPGAGPKISYNCQNLFEFRANARVKFSLGNLTDAFWNHFLNYKMSTPNFLPHFFKTFNWEFGQNNEHNFIN